MKSRRHRAIRRATVRYYNSRNQKFIQMMRDSELFVESYVEGASLLPFQKQFLSMVLRNYGKIPRGAKMMFGVDLATPGSEDSTVITQMYGKDGNLVVVDTEMGYEGYVK